MINVKRRIRADRLLTDKLDITLAECDEHAPRKDRIITIGYVSQVFHCHISLRHEHIGDFEK